MAVDESCQYFPESAAALLAPYNKEDLPFTQNEGSAVNAQKKFKKSWSIENPVNRTLAKSVVFKLGAHESQDFVIVLQAPMTVSCFNMMGKLTLNLIPAESDRKSLIEKRIVGNSKAKIERRTLEV